MDDNSTLRGIMKRSANELFERHFSPKPLTLDFVNWLVLHVTLFQGGGGGGEGGGLIQIQNEFFDLIG